MTTRAIYGALMNGLHFIFRCRVGCHGWDTEWSLTTASRWNADRLDSSQRGTGAFYPGVPVGRRDTPGTVSLPAFGEENALLVRALDRKPLWSRSQALG